MLKLANLRSQVFLSVSMSKSVSVFINLFLPLSIVATALFPFIFSLDALIRKKHQIVIPSNRSNKDTYDNPKRESARRDMHRWATTNKSIDRFLTRYLKIISCIHTLPNNEEYMECLFNTLLSCTIYFECLHLFSLTFHP